MGLPGGVSGEPDRIKRPGDVCGLSNIPWSHSVQKSFTLRTKCGIIEQNEGRVFYGKSCRHHRPPVRQRRTHHRHSWDWSRFWLAAATMSTASPSWCSLVPGTATDLAASVRASSGERPWAVPGVLCHGPRRWYAGRGGRSAVRADPVPAGYLGVQGGGACIYPGGERLCGGLYRMELRTAMPSRQ